MRKSVFNEVLARKFRKEESGSGVGMAEGVYGRENEKEEKR